MFFIPVRSGDSLRDRVLGKNKVEEIEIRFVGVRRRTYAWGERWGATDTTQLRSRK